MFKVLKGCLKGILGLIEKLSRFLLGFRKGSKKTLFKGSVDVSMSNVRAF